MKIGFIGCGNMAKAMLGGIRKAELVSKEEIIASTSREETLRGVAEEFGIQTTLDNRKVAGEADILILAVKPMYYEKILTEIRDVLKPEKVLVSIAPGKTLDWLYETAGCENLPIVRCMPNTPALVGEGITGVCKNPYVTEEQMASVGRILSSCGLVEEVAEHQMEAVVAVSGSSPAYVFLFIEAMADAAVAEGMPRAQAYRFASQAILGSAKMVLETGKHPGELKDMVCSPAGTTIEAVRVLEEKGFRSAVIEAMHACAEKAR